MNTHTIEVSVVAYQVEDRWVAQGLEYDIAAFAQNAKDLPSAFYRALAANICANAAMGRTGLEGVKPAPAHFRKMYDEAELEVTPIIEGGSADSRVGIRDMRLAA